MLNSGKKKYSNSGVFRNFFFNQNKKPVLGVDGV
jgi:hypothetical protein